MAPGGDLDLVAELLAIARALGASSLPYAVCGGVAVTIHGAVRSTKDIDLLVRREDRTAVLAKVGELGFVLEALPMVFGAGTEAAREVQRVSKPGGGALLTLDLLFVDPIYAQIWDRRERVDWEGTPLWVVSREGLIQMKRIAGRLQDLADIEKLEAPDDDA
jgi:hypothetical protein